MLTIASADYRDAAARDNRGLVGYKSRIAVVGNLEVTARRILHVVEGRIVRIDGRLRSAR